MPAIPDLIDPARLPHAALRSAETTLKRRTYAVENDAVLRLLSHYRAASRALRDFMDTQSTTSTQWRSNVVAFAGMVVADLKRAVLATVEQSARAALLGNYYGRLWLLDVSTGEDMRISVPPLTVNGLQEDYYDDLIRDLLGKQWRDQYALEMDDLNLRIRRAIGTGLVDGEGMQAIQRRVRDAIGVTTDRRSGQVGSAERKGYRANFNRVQALTRTVVQSVANKGAVSAYRANPDVLSGYEILVTNDERTCPQCSGLNGKRLKLDSNFRPPFHPNCRCTVIPVIKPDALTDSNEMPRETLQQWSQGAGMDKELADFLGVKQSQLPAPRQVRVVAPSRAVSNQPLSVGQIKSEVHKTGLDPDDWQESVFDYTQTDYRNLIDAQTSVADDWYDASEYQQWVDKANKIEAGLRSLPAYNGEIYRGISVDNLESIRGGNVQIGGVLQTDALSSFTRNSNVRTYIGEESNVIFRVRGNQSGASIENIAWRGSEGEVLVPSKTTYRIRAITERSSFASNSPFARDSGWLIDLEEIVP